jgi:hypothetical protein
VDQSPLKPLPGFDLRPSDRIFRDGVPINPRAVAMAYGVSPLPARLTIDDGVRMALRKRRRRP